ncbi:signal peptidase complex subunit 2-like isoform X2 [Andrographis paniculata]|uniref:signal peptidase complex subunit 2-like isoform X2 n=1 Tax=Andrographis paniculata TaxID=175694 RepID=UPI0021E93E76|nr:signal peptidase complex subunit 2-like isoform X2 [Andrographis paniculata]
MAAQKNSKKTNLLDSHSVKHALDESVTEIVNSKGYPEDFRTSNVRLLIGIIIIVVALFAQFYNKKFPENRNFLVGCIVFVRLSVTRSLCEAYSKRSLILCKSTLRFCESIRIRVFSGTSKTGWLINIILRSVIVVLVLISRSKVHLLVPFLSK